MFDSEYFTKLINETVDFIQNKDKFTEVDDLDAKIESNKLALKIIAEDIEDQNLKINILNRLDNLYDTYQDIEIKQREIKNEQFADVEEDILKNTKLLKSKAKRLYDGLLFDRDVLDKVNSRITKNITDTSENIKKIGKRTNKINSLSMLIYGILLFLIIYFIIRFL